MKWIDVPPVWLLACLIATYWIGQFQPAFPDLSAPVFGVLGAVLVGVGLALMVLAVFEMRRFRTTVIPHLTAVHLVRSGIFARTRNPIYLGDMLVLAGCMVRWDAAYAVPVLGVLFLALDRRFIRPEEARLSRDFGAEFDAYIAQTPRWI